MKRNKCIICEGNTFIPVISLLNTKNIVTTEEYSNEEINTLQFIGCEICGCVQLKNLFLQDEIYSQPLQIFNGPAIQKHHDLFCDFIIKNIHYESTLFEIGGSYGNLAKKIISRYRENESKIIYKIMEFSAEHYPIIDNIEYISGNCESLDYYGINTIIMSHVFEHLYNPKEFIKKISNTKIQNIFISIPDMDGLIKKGDINNLNILHTFYINTPYIRHLFSEYNFYIKEMYNFDNNSIFYFFKKCENIDTSLHICSFKTPMSRSLGEVNDEGVADCEFEMRNTVKEIQKNDSWYNKRLPIDQKLFYESIIEKIKNINITEPFFICPSGFYGQFVYFYLNNETKKNIIGFLDGDKFKINKRLSGTKSYIFEKKEIEKYEKITVLVASSKHNTEIIDELLIYNKNIRILGI
jgi:hypothetical protein